MVKAGNALLDRNNLSCLLSFRKHKILYDLKSESFDQESTIIVKGHVHANRKLKHFRLQSCLNRGFPKLHKYDILGIFVLKIHVAVGN